MLSENSERHCRRSICRRDVRGGASVYRKTVYENSDHPPCRSGIRAMDVPPCKNSLWVNIRFASPRPMHPNTRRDVALASRRYRGPATASAPVIVVGNELKRKARVSRLCVMHSPEYWCARLTSRRATPYIDKLRV